MTSSTVTSPSSSPLAHCVILALLSALLATYVRARSVDSGDVTDTHHVGDKRFYIPVIISSDAILDSLKDRRVPLQSIIKGADFSQPEVSSGLEHKRTAAAKLEYLDSLLPRSVVPKRKMFWSPLGYMSASARRLNQNSPQSRGPSNKEDAGSPGFRYG